MRRIFALAAFAALIFAVVAPARAQLGGAPPPLPDGDGKAIVAVACSQCHTLGVTLTMRAAKDGWRQQVYDMVLRGAQLTGPEADQVIDYLATYFGPGTKLPEAAGEPVALPAGAGKDVVEANCMTCHDARRLTGAKRSRKEWEGIVARMVHLGAPADPEDAKKITAYLDQQFGKN
jgi:mono/diheme cytochrome c family protein